MMTGILSLLVFFTNLDKLALFVSSNTMQGFKLAVGIIIAGNQINFALGLDNYPRHPSFLDNLIENLSHIGETEWQAVVMFFSFLLGQIALSKLVPSVPWSIVLVCIGILCGYLTNIEGFSGYKIRTLDSRYPGLTLSIFSLPEFKPEFFEPRTLYVLSFHAVSISFVAILETVISAKIADRMTNTKFNQRQEVMALSFANFFAGFFGGMPGTAALVRTALNIKSGATSRLSGIICSVTVTVLALLLLPYFKFLPLPNIASIVVLAALQMIDLEELQLVYTSTRHMVILVVVMVTCVFVDPASGVVVGILLGLGKGAFLESKAWVFCKLRQGDFVLAKFNCDLEVEEKVFAGLTTEPLFDDKVLQCLQPRACLQPRIKDKSFDEQVQIHVFSKTPARAAGPGDARKASTGPGQGSLGELGDADYHLVLEYKIGGPLTYVTASTHCKRFADIAVDHVLLNLSRVTEIDIDGVAALEELFAGLKAQGKNAYIGGIHKGIRHVIEHAEFFEHLAAERRVLRSYKADKQLFLTEAAPPGSVSVAQRGLHRYLRDANVTPRTAGRPSGDGPVITPAAGPASSGRWGVDISE